ncbi:uncharacterized protein [Polyergus mexicanus]|uniref:uncharacterized protein n=1 Tax=Polyergus mexicanus TaxID=615972 RepID=UPI0038B62CDC
MAGLKEVLVLSDESSEINYLVFRAFACASSNTILAMLYRLGYFGNYAELLHIAGEIIEMREAFDHEEEDADGLIAFLLSNHRGNRLNGRARSAENDSEADITASPVQRGGGGQNEEATPEERTAQLCNNEEVTDMDENEEEVVGEERCNPSSETEDGEEEPEVEEEQQRHEVGDINFNYVDLLTENRRQFRRLCRTPQSRNHLCHMQPLRKTVSSSTEPSSSTAMTTLISDTRGTTKSKEAAGEEVNESKKDLVAFIFYDFETRQDETLESTMNVKKHVPTLCIAQQICEGDACRKMRCRWCRIREFIFRHDPVKQFVEFATRRTKRFNQIICIAHNAKAFDAQFILQYIVENRNYLKPKIILSGTKIVMLLAGNTKFIDSANYMPMRLSELPKAFGLGDSVDKGTFPHLFNTVENQTYVRPLPDAKYYSPENMKTSERERFLAWHTDMTRKNIVIDFQQEIVRYCRTDVDILRRACIAFKKIFINRGNVCPFEECTTIASTCMIVFRKNFLCKKEIGIIPSGGYRKASNYSRKALQWLIWMEREIGHPIKHAGRAREYRTTDGTLVNGYYETTAVETTQRHILQFHGCFWHGCPTCFPSNRDKALSSTSDHGDTIASRYEQTLAISWRLRQRGYMVTEKWECVFDRDMLENREMREYLENHLLVETPPLDPRDAFFGGRMGNIVTRYEVTGAEKIRYVNVCSLYPYVLKTGAFPIGNPDIYVGKECATLIGIAPNYNFDSLEGLIRCTVLPPRNLFHPVLPYRVRGKLLFALCRSCCETFAQTFCTHDSINEREFEGGLFAEYINSFLQLKQEASGWPGECGDDDDAKERYLREYEKTEGKIRPAANLPNTEVVRTLQRFLTLLTSSEHEITDILPVNDDVIYVSWRLRQEAVMPSPITNVAIAAYTTAQARLKLYEYLERLDRRVLYYVTDSYIYVSTGKPNEYEPHTGNFLGDMTDELESYGRGSYIEAFVSGGPKFYAYVVRMADGRTRECCKVKGITLNYENSRLVNFNSIKNLLLNKEGAQENEKNGEELPKTSINLCFRAIRRTTFHEIVTRDETKVCAPVLLKRRFIDSRNSLPYGYVSQQ